MGEPYGVKLEVSGRMPGNVCLVCGKIAFGTRGDAVQQARWQARKRGVPMKPYFSEACDVWHLSRVE